MELAVISLSILCLILAVLLVVSIACKVVSSNSIDNPWLSDNHQDNHKPHDDTDPPPTLRGPWGR